MRILSLLLQYSCLIFACYLSYHITIHYNDPTYPIMDLVADVGTIFICVDLFVFLATKRISKDMTVEEYAQQLEQPPSKWVNATRKLGHLGIMLILCSWIVPMIN